MKKILFYLSLFILANSIFAQNDTTFNRVYYKSSSAASTVLKKNTYVSSPNVYINTINDNILEINTEIQNYNIYLYNSIGQLIVSKESISSSYQLSIGDLPTGIYIVNIKGSNINKTYKFIKN